MKIGMLFPGYGSQFVGMGKELYDDSRVMQEYFEEASNCLDVNFVKLCFASSDAELAQFHNAYPAIFLMSTSIAALLKERGIVPHVVAGYNLGEYSALSCAGSINLPDGLYLLNKYARAYQETLGSIDVVAVHVTGLASGDVERICSQVSTELQPVRVALYNSETDHIVTGHRFAIASFGDAVRQIKDESGDSSIKVAEISLGVGLHSSLMDGVINNFKMYLAKADFKDTALLAISAIHANELGSGQQVRDAIIEQIHSSVRWHDVMKKLADCDCFIEVGPGSELSAFARQMYPHKTIMTVNKPSDVEEIINYITARSL